MRVAMRCGISIPKDWRELVGGTQERTYRSLETEMEKEFEILQGQYEIFLEITVICGQPIGSLLTNISTARQTARQHPEGLKAIAWHVKSAMHVKSGIRMLNITHALIQYLTRLQIVTVALQAIRVNAPLHAISTAQVGCQRNTEVQTMFQKALLPIILLLGIAFVFGVVCGIWTSQQMSIDGCLDRGGHWSKTYNACDV
jgi:hypothetical protein